MKHRAFVYTAAVSVLLLIVGACSSADDPTLQPTVAAQVAPTTAPVSAPTTPPAPAAVPTLAPSAAQQAAPILAASEVITKAAEAIGVPLQLPQPPAVYAPIRGGSVDLVTNGWPFPRYWNWQVQGAYSNMYISLYAETLVTFPQGPGTNPADYTPQPHLAESWSISDDNLTYTFKLRKGVKFNSEMVDGIDTSKDVTAQDWVDLAELSFGIETSRFNSRYPEIDGPESWKAIDDYTLEISLNRPVAAFLYKLAIRGPQLYGLQGVNRRVEEEGIDIEEAMKSHEVQVGTGPWLLTGWTPDISVTYTANPVYWKKDAEGSALPFIDKVEMFVMKNEAAQDAGFRTGKLGAIALETCGMSTERYKDINASNPDTVWEIFVDPTNQRSVFPNFSEGTPWHDIRVRRAMQLAIDKEGWVDSVLGGWGLPFATVLAPGNQYWLPPGQYGDVDGDGIPGEKYLEYDVEEAKRLMAEAGFANGIKGTFALTNDLGGRFFSEGELIVESLRKIGIDLTIDVKDGAAREALREAGDFDLFYSFPGYGWDPSDWLSRGYHSQNTRNLEPVSGLVDLVLDKMIEAEEAAVDPAERWELVADVQRYLQEKQYYQMSTNWLQIIAIAPWLKNYQYQYSYPIGPNLALAWVDR
ncbi:MAG: ABC transporter substrate-binding protein [Chloroflexi bacterium]|nr:ABC transporter substrate-binding protein [Chloroflexota bacterium]